jgi:hypothetical protein
MKQAASKARETYRRAPLSTSFHPGFARLIFRPWRWRRYFPPKRRLTFNRLHRVISQKIVLFCLNLTSRIPDNALRVGLLLVFQVWMENTRNCLMFYILLASFLFSCRKLRGSNSGVIFLKFEYSKWVGIGKKENEKKNRNGYSCNSFNYLNIGKHLLH